MDFGNGGLSSDFPSRDPFMVMYRSDGLHLRDRAPGGNGDQGARGIVIGSGGSTTVVGEFYGSIDVGSGTRTGNGGFIFRTAD